MSIIMSIHKSILDLAVDPGSYSVSHLQLTTENVLNESKSGDGQYILVPKSGNFNFTEVRNYIKINLN